MTDLHDSFLVFLIVTVALAGGAAWMTGRAIAMTWRPLYLLALYPMLLAAFVRFLHFSLFGAPLLSVPGYLVDATVLVAIAALSFRVHRTKQMVTQYNWLYERTGPLSWRERPAAPTSSAH